jgi:hypothetical protein
VGPSEGKINVFTCKDGKQRNRDETVDPDHGPHEAGRQVLQQPRNPQMRKEHSDVLEAGMSEIPFRDHLDVRKQIEVFVIFVFAALAEADGLLRFDEFDALDPLDHFVAKLVFNPQPQWSSIDLGQWLAIHL